VRISVEQKEATIVVSVEVSQYWPAGNISKKRIQTADVLSSLEEQGINHGKCIKESDVKNWRKHSCRGEWIFEKEKPRKIKKVLDKLPEEVILEEEKVVTPKKRVRSSPKKVSTEE